MWNRSATVQKVPHPLMPVPPLQSRCCTMLGLLVFLVTLGFCFITWKMKVIILIPPSLFMGASEGLWGVMLNSQSISEQLFIVLSFLWSPSHCLKNVLSISVCIQSSILTSGLFLFLCIFLFSFFSFWASPVLVPTQLFLQPETWWAQDPSCGVQVYDHFHNLV